MSSDPHDLNKEVGTAKKNAGKHTKYEDRKKQLWTSQQQGKYAMK